MKNRFLSILLAVCMIISILPAAVLAANVEDFKDVDPNEWYYPWVSNVVKNNYFVGTSESTFEPDAPMTRAMVVTVLYRMSGDRILTSDKQHGFTDVAADAWYNDAVAWAKKTGVTKGITATTFEPEEAVDREQLAAFIDRMITYMAQRGNVSFGHMMTQTATAFSDGDKISDWAKTSVQNCQKYGIIVGYPAANGETANSFRPAGEATRAEASKVVAAVSNILRNGVSNWYWEDTQPDVYSYTVNYHYGDNLASHKTEPFTSYTEQASYDAVITSFVPGSYKVGDLKYDFVGWSDSMGNGALGSVQYKAGDVISVPKNGQVTLYAVYVPANDKVYEAMTNVVSDLKTLADKLNQASITVGGHTATMGTFDASVSVGNLTAGALRNSVQIDIAAALDSSLIERVLEIGTTYAVALLNGTQTLPTRDQITDVVYDVSNQLGLTLNNVNVRAIANAVYDKLADTGADVFANFRNFNGKFCISKITVEDGKMVLTVNDANGLMGSGFDSNLQMVKALAGNIAKEMYGKLNQMGGSVVENGTNVLKLYSVVTLDFTPVAGVALNDACYIYDLHLNLNLASDMVKYVWDGSKGTVILTLNQALQTQYTESVEAIVDAALVNNSAKSYISKEVKSALSGLSAIDTLKNYLDANSVNDAIDLAINSWLTTNLTNADADPAAPYVYLYQYLWKYEGAILNNGGTYSIEGGKVLGDNAALHSVFKTLLTQIASSQIVTDKLAEIETNDIFNYMDANTRVGVVNAGVLTFLDQQSATMNQDLKYYIANLVTVNYARSKGYTDAVNTYENAISTTNEPKVDAYIDQMLMGSLYDLEFSGKSLTELLGMLYDFKSLDALSDQTLGQVASLLEMDLFQKYAAKGNAFVQYVAQAIDMIPDGASVQVNGATLNSASLSGVRDADDMAELCDNLAILFREPGLKTLSVDTFASAQDITVKYNARTFTFGLQIVIE